MAKIVFKTDLDNKDLEAQLKKAKATIEREQKSVQKSEAAKLPLTQQMDELSASVEEAARKLAVLEAKKKTIATALTGKAGPEAYASAFAQQKTIDKDYSAQLRETEKLQKKWESVANKVDAYDAKIKASTAAITENQATAGKLQARMSSGGYKLSEAMGAAATHAKKFETRMIGLAKRVLIFSVITAGLRKAKEYMSGLLMQNEEYRQELARLKGALMTAFQPIYEAILPGLLAIMRVVTAVVQVVANVLSRLRGSAGKASADAAKALNEEKKAIKGVGTEAKVASRELAGFDEINKLTTSTAGGSGVPGIDAAGPVQPDFTAFDTEEYRRKIDELTVYLSTALLALGVILTFSGAAIPLGLALIAAGAAGLAAEVSTNWDTVRDLLQGKFGAIVALASTFALVLGLVLAFSGVALPLGIALIALGAAGLATTVAVNWNSIVTALQGPIGEVVAIASGALLVLGIILLFSGVGIPLGLGLILAGAAGLATVVYANWDFITEKVSDAWDSVKQFWSDHIAPVFTKAWWMEKFQVIGDGLKEALKKGINKGIDLINSFTGWLNSILSFTIPPLVIRGRTIYNGFSTSVNIPQIPYLAKGAVLPANNPFLAVVGDQRSGTNIEAPLDTIKQAVAEVLGSGGNERVVELLEIIAARTGVYLDGKKISQAVSTYQRQTARAGGGL